MLLWAGDFPGKNTGVGCHFLLQGIFPTQESNLGLVNCRRILYRMSYRGSPLTYIHSCSKFLTKSRYSYSRDAPVVALVSVLTICHLDCRDGILPDFSPHPQQSSSRCTRMNLLKIHLIMSSPPERSPAFPLCPEDPLNSVTNKRLYSLAPVYPSSLIACHTPTFMLCTMAALIFCPFPNWPCPVLYYSYGPYPSSPYLQIKVVQHDFYL